jgi:Uma2 family endonuclease
MSIATRSASTSTAVDALAPLRLPPDLRLSPEQFERVCAENRDAVLELTADGRVIPMPPTGSETGARNARLEMRLLLWADQQGGWKVFGCSSGFRLPDGSVLSPDASLVRLDRWQALGSAARRGFAPLCPDLVVELASPSDEEPRGVIALRRKMAAYQANGARLGWLILPERRSVEQWPAQGPSTRLENATVLEAGPEFPGLTLDLSEIWADGDG